MRVLAIGMALAMLMTTACLVSPSSSGKKLLRSHGGKLTDEQLQKNRKKLIEVAKDIVYDACENLLNKGSWSEIENGEGFFVYQIKPQGIVSKGTNCPTQYVTVDLQAVYHIGRHGISCSISREGLLQINVPSHNKADAVKILCNARLVDLHLSDAGMRVSSFTDTGNTYTAIISHEGYLQHDVNNVVTGVSKQRAAQLSSMITDAKLAASAANKPAALMIADSDTAITGALAGIVASEAATTKTSGVTEVELIDTNNKARLFVSTPVGLILALRTFIWSQSKKSNDDFVQVVPAMRALLHAHLKSTATKLYQGDRQ